MKGSTKKMVLLALFVAGLAMPGAVAAPGKGDIAPSFPALEDIKGQKVDLEAILATTPDMVILYFFTTQGGAEMAGRLSAIDALYGRDKLRIIAFGVKEEKAALTKFAQELGIEYYVLSDDPVSSLYGPYAGLPLTFILKNDKTVVKVVRGSGETAGALLTEVAETYLMQGKTDQAAKVATVAQEKGEDATKATEVRGYALTAAGKLDEAQKEFGAINSQEGMAKVALERGENEKAIDLATKAGSGYADTIKGTAYMRSGDLDKAGAAFDAAAQKPASDWQTSEALNGQGRLMQEKGVAEGAIQKYDQAFAVDPFNVVALSNEGAAYRAEGNLEKASEALGKARAVRDDDLVVCMLKQVTDELEKASDVKRGELIRQQIADLAKRYQEIKQSGAKPADEWSSRPLVLAFLPSSNKAPVFFERAGTDVVLKRELESQVQASGAATVVEREMIDKLLQELNLGSSELANKDTQLQLGKVLAAKHLGFVDFAQAGQDIVMYLRLVDTETTAIAQQLTRNIKEDGIAATAQGLAQELVAKIKDGGDLKGLIAEAASDDAVVINLGKGHGIVPGQKFTILVEGTPIEVGGRVVGHRSKPVGILEVTAVEDTYATCKVVQKDAGVTLAKEMKIKAAKAQ